MFSCSACGYSSATKLGKCPQCAAFGSFVQTTASHKESKSKHSRHQWSVLSIADNNISSRFRTLANTEFQRVLQQGIKPGGVYLLGWEPGIGKSTIILQILQDLLAHNDMAIQYFTGEEQANQIQERRKRLFSSSTKDEPSRHPEQPVPIISGSEGSSSDNLDSSPTVQNDEANSQELTANSQNIQIYHSTHIEDILTTAENSKPDLIVVDSIQTIYSQHNDSGAGSPNQVKYCAEKLSEFGKQQNCAIIIIGHVTKGGEIAGPKYLEHIVDVVLYLEGDRFGQLRFLRGQKNRFGHTDDSGIFEMTLFGLQPVYDLKERILQAASTMPWSVLSIGLDNGRPVITQVEVLLNKTKFKFPQRNCIGVDAKRVDLVIAILERYLKINLGLFDIFVNIPGEFDFRDSGIDLAIAVWIYSQYTNTSVPQHTIFLGELALSGKIVKAKLHEKRAKEVDGQFSLIDYNNTTYITNIKTLAYT